MRLECLSDLLYLQFLDLGRVTASASTVMSGTKNLLENRGLETIPGSGKIGQKNHSVQPGRREPRLMTGEGEQRTVSPDSTQHVMKLKTQQKAQTERVL